MSDKKAAQSSTQPWDRKWSSKSWGAALVFLYLAAVAAPLVLALIHEPSSFRSFWGELGKGFGLAGFAILALQTVLNARFRIFEAPFGYDVVTRFHRTMAIVALVMLLAHPLLLALDMGSLFLFSLDTSWKIYLGKFTLLFVLLAVPFALFFRFLGLNYQTWRVMHKAMIAVIVLAFAHGWFAGSDLDNAGVQAVFIVLLASAVAIFVYRNAILPFVGRYRYTVEGVDKAARDVYTLTLKPVNGGMPPHDAGQFAFLKLTRPGRRSEEHPFTIPSSPMERGHVQFTIKRSGDFTNTIGDTRPGDKAFLEGPLGRFSPVHYEAPCFLFIAGGVGITPIISMLRYLRDIKDQRRGLLLYANHAEPDIIFRDELASLPHNMSVVHVLKEAPENWSGEEGLITQDIIRRHAGEILDKCHVMLCGPPPMMDAVLESLNNLGIEPQRIHFEKFSL
ncbi:MAG: ferredoxin reductase family protein [Candidatus Hydrogenedentota bacterium]